MANTLEELQYLNQAPSWLTVEGLATLSNGYLQKEETPRDMYERCAKRAAENLGMPDLESEFFNMLWHGWLGLATPVAANLGTERALPISCFGMSVEDSMAAIANSWGEMAMLSNKGGGISVNLSHIRGAGEPIGTSGQSEGVMSWSKVYASVIGATSQSGVRRGAASLYLDIDHKDFDDFLRLRRAHELRHIHHGICITDEFMNKLISGDAEARRKWAEILKTRIETGEPYLYFSDTVNKANPPCYVDKGFTVPMSNLCTEITLYTDYEHTFVCCLSSLNIAKYDEWKNTNTPYLATLFLDGVMEEFVRKAEGKQGLTRAWNFAVKSRALGLGVLGYHTYLQSKSIPFASEEARQLNREIFQNIQQQALKASKYLAEELGEPEWCKGYGIRNTHTTTVAPTASNSILCGNVSPGIEPVTSNAYIKGSAKGNFINRNPYLKALLAKYDKDTSDVWQYIITHKGSVQGLDFLSQHEKEVFKTAREIDQLEVINQAADRQQYIDQGQSVNLFFTDKTEPNYINKVHVQAWKKGLKTLYYCRSESVLAGDTSSDVISDLLAKEEEEKNTSIPTLCEITNPTECIPCQG